MEVSRSIYSYTKFGKEGLYSQRFSFYEYYANQIDIKTFLIGVSPDNPIFRILFISTHNSYILLHLHMGVGVFFLIYMLILSAVVFVKQRKLILFGCVLAIGIRAFTDTHLIRGNYLQFGIIVALFLMALSLRNDNKKRRSGDEPVSQIKKSLQYRRRCGFG